jgi:predicted small metal-binding protein
MKTMKCKQLGGACDKEFQANTFDEIVELSKSHGKEMFQIQDADHLAAMQKISSLMQKPGAMQAWFKGKRNEFEALAEN